MSGAWDGLAHLPPRPGSSLRPADPEWATLLPLCLCPPRPSQRASPMRTLGWPGTERPLDKSHMLWRQKNDKVRFAFRMVTRNLLWQLCWTWVTFVGSLPGSCSRDPRMTDKGL